jgi:hypothetical protein
MAQELMLTMVKYVYEAKKKFSRVSGPDKAKWQAASLIEVIALPFGVERLEMDYTFPMFVSLYRQVLKDLNLQDDFNPLPFTEIFGENLHWQEHLSGGQQ